jgi:hypothetical protein
VVVEPVTGGWVLVAPTVENASVLVVVPAVAGAWALTGPAARVGPLGPMSAMTWSPTLTTTWRTDPVMTAGALAGASSRIRAFGVHWEVA